MNSILGLSSVEWWQVAGWTMVHYLWLGTAVAAVAWFAQLMLRRVTPSARYVAALCALGTLTALPVAIAAWLVSTGPATQVAAAGDGSAGIEKAGSLERGAGSDQRITAAGASALESPAGSSLDNSPIIELTERPSNPEIAAILAAASASDSKLDISNVQSTGTASGTPANDLAQVKIGTLFNSLLEPVIAYLPWLWLIGSPLTFGLLATGLVVTRRMRSASQAIESGAICEACTRLARSLGVTRRVAIAMCERVAAPVLIGILRPVILLPPAAITGWSPAEIEMVLLHELAHVRRWDNLVNLLQRIVESLLFFHPAVWLASNWVRREREACCDAIVVGQTHQPRAYAEMLVAVAARMPRSALFTPAAASAMAAGPLRFRIRKILKLEDDPMLVSGKSLAAATFVLLVAVPVSVMQLASGGKAENAAMVVGTGAFDVERPADNGPRVVDEMAQAPQIPSDAQSNALWRAVFETGADNESRTATYDVLPRWQERDMLKTTFEGWQTDPFGPRIQFTARWSADKSTVEIVAPQLAHELIFKLLNEAPGFGDEAQLLLAKAKPQLQTIRADVPADQLSAIDSCVGQLAKLQKEESACQARYLRAAAECGDALLSLKEPTSHQRYEILNRYRSDMESLTRTAIDLHKAIASAGAELQLLLVTAGPQDGAIADDNAKKDAPAEPLVVARPLVNAVRDFNEKAQKDPIGLTQPPLTEEEVKAAIRGWMRETIPVSDETYSGYEKIAETGSIPPEAKLDFTTHWETESQKFDVWWIDLTINAGQESGYKFRIRDIKIRSRALTPEEIAAQSRIVRTTFASERLAEWDKLVAEVPRLDAVAIKQAWEKYGLKLLPTTSSTAPPEIRRLNGGNERNVKEFHFLTIVGGNLPPNLPPNSILLDIDSDQPFTASLLYSRVKDPRPTEAECIAFANGQTYVFRTQPPTAKPATSAVTSPTDPAFYQQQMRVENNQLVVTLTDAQMQAGLRTRILSVVDAIAPSATVRMNGNELTVFGVDADQMSTMTKLIRGALTSGFKPGELGGNLPQTTTGFSGRGSTTPTSSGPWGVTTPRSTDSGLPLAGTIDTPRTTFETESAMPSAVENVGRSALRFEGKPFDVWRDAWQTELNPEKRLAALKALVAFGANGYGKQAAEAILDVTKLYDLSTSDDSPAAAPLTQLKLQAEAAFGWEGNSQAIPWRDWLPALATKVRSGDAGSVLFTDHVFRKLENTVGNRKSRYAPELLTLSRDSTLRPIRAPILRLLSQFNLQKRDKQIELRMVEAFKNPDVEVVQAALNALYMQPFQRYQMEVQMAGGPNMGMATGKPEFELEYHPELADLLRSDDFSLRSSAFGALELLGPKAAPAVPELLPLTLEQRVGNFDWAAAAENAAGVITGTDQTVYRYWKTIIADDSQPVEKVAVAKDRIRNWEEANKQREDDLKRFNEQQAGGQPGAAPPLSDPRRR